MRPDNVKGGGAGVRSSQGLRRALPLAQGTPAESSESEQAPDWIAGRLAAYHMTTKGLRACNIKDAGIMDVDKIQWFWDEPVCAVTPVPLKP